MAGSTQQMLGSLEREIMVILWEQEVGTVREVHQVIVTKRNLAYTTVMTTMTRMATKGLLEQMQHKPRGFRYRPIMTRIEFLRAVSARIGEKLEALATERQQLLVSIIHLWNTSDAASEERQQVVMAIIHLWDKLDAVTIELQHLRTVLA